MTTNSYDPLLKQVSSLLTQLGVLPALIKPQAHLKRDLGLDSLDTVDLMMRLEQAFFLSISDEQMSGIQTVDEAVRFLADELTLGQANPPRTIPFVYPDAFAHL